MTRHDEFWRHVDAALDAHLDPLEDPNVQQLVAEDPSLLDEFARLHARLSVVDVQPPTPRFRRVAAATLFVLAASVVAWVLLSYRERSPATDEHGTVPNAERSPALQNGAPLATTTSNDSLAPRIFSFRSESTHRDERGIKTVVFDGSTRSESFVSFERPTDPSTPYLSSFLAAASSFSNGQ